MTAIYTFGEFKFDLFRRELRRGEQLIELQPRVFAVMELLVSQAGEALSKDDFLERVWSGRFVTENVLTRCIRELRRELQDDANNPRYIRTVRGFGYQFIAPLQRDDSRNAQLPAVQKLAVLPFQPLVPSDGNAALEMGLAVNLVTDLSRLADMVVRPMAAVLDVKARHPKVGDPVEIGRILQVDVVIEGGLQIVNQRVRLNLRAIRITDGTALLAEQFEEPLEDLFTVQDRLCQRITLGLALRLSEHKDGARLRRGTRQFGAYREYVNGRLKLAEHTEEAAKAALLNFEQALRLDPQYAEALVGVAEVHDLLGTLGTRPKYHFETMREAAQNALIIEPALARAHACLGKVEWQYDWQWQAAEAHFRKAIELDEADAENLVAYSDFLAYQDRYEESLAVAERAGEINPFSPWIQALITQALYMGRQYRAAEEQGRRALQQAPGMSFSQLFLSLSLIKQKQYKEAIELLKEAIKNSRRDDFIGVLGYALARSGDNDAAREMLVQLATRHASGAEAPPIASAYIHLGLRQFDEAIKAMEKVMAERSWHILLLYADPLFDDLRARPEGLALLQKCGLR